jgi:hypothetical protein
LRQVSVFMIGTGPLRCVSQVPDFRRTYSRMVCALTLLIFGC